MSMKEDLPDDPDVLKEEVMRLQEELERREQALVESEKLVLELKSELNELESSAGVPGLDDKYSRLLNFIRQAKKVSEKSEDYKRRADEASERADDAMDRLGYNDEDGEDH